MKRAALALALALLLSGCFGPFRTTTRVHRWNDHVSGEKWVKEGIFLVLVIVPVYQLVLLGDLIIFNPIEFFTDDSPMK